MKQTMLFILMIIACGLPAYSQDISNLDNANGFKDLKLGTSVSSFGNSISLINETDYEYNGGCCRTIFGSDVRFITLNFDKAKQLSDIIVRTNKKFYSTDQIMDQVRIIANEFGKPAVDTTAARQTSVFVWTGIKVKLTVTFFFIEVSSNSDEPVYTAQYHYSAIGSAPALLKTAKRVKDY